MSMIRVQGRQNIKIFQLFINSFNMLLDTIISFKNQRKNKSMVETVIQNISVTSGQNILEISYLKESVWHNSQTKICKINPLYGINTSLLNQFLVNEHVSQDAMFISCVSTLNKRMNYDSDSFDSCYLSLAYKDILSPNKTYELSEIRRVLKQDGMLYLSQQSYVDYKGLNDMLKKFDHRLSFKQTQDCVKEHLDAVLDAVKGDFKEVNHTSYKNDFFSWPIDAFIFYLLTNPNIKDIKQVVSEKGIHDFKNYLLKFCEDGKCIILPTRYDLITCRK